MQVNHSFFRKLFSVLCLLLSLGLSSLVLLPRCLCIHKDRGIDRGVCDHDRDGRQNHLLQSRLLHL